MQSELPFVNAKTIARTVCNVNSCSHICAVVDGIDTCYCPGGLEFAPGSLTTCQGNKTEKLTRGI